MLLDALCDPLGNEARRVNRTRSVWSNLLGKHVLHSECLAGRRRTMESRATQSA